MANRRFIDFPIASTSGDTDIILIWQDGANKQTTKATFLSGLPENLDELNDVAISGLTNGQILRYDSVTGKWENTDQGNLDLNDLNDVSIVSPSNGQVLVYNSSTSKWENSSGGYVPYTGAVTTVNLGAQTIQAGSFVKAGGTSAQFLKADGSVDSNTYGTGTVTSVALTMPAAFSVANSPVTTAGTLAVTGAGNASQYIAGDGTLVSFPSLTGYVPYTGANQTVDLNTQQLQAGHTTLTTNGSTETLTINHTSGSGKAINVTKGGAGEGLYIDKTSGSGNAATIVGTLEATTLVKTGGTSSQFLKADGSVDSTSYGTGTVTSVGLSSATSGVTIGSTPVTTSGTITLAIATASGSQNGLLSSTDWTTFNGKQNALTNPVTGTGSVGQVAYWSSSSAITGESNLFWDGTNDRLGIGTGSPSNTLTIKNNNPATSGIDFQSFASLSVQGKIVFDQGDDTFNFTNTSAFAAGGIVFKTNSTTKFQIFTDGNVLIQSGGTFTNNGARLQVSGTATFSGNVGIGGITLNVSGYSGKTLTIGNGTQSENAIEIYSNTTTNETLGDLTWVNAASSDADKRTSIIRANRIGANNSSSFTFFTKNLGTFISSMTITSSGSVGIGTTSPAKKLDVYENSTASVAQYIRNTTVNGLLQIDGTSNFQVGTETNHPLFLLTNNATRVLITGGGNVGIGTTSPGTKLHIISDLGTNALAIGETGSNQRFVLGQESSYTGNYINSTNIDLKLITYRAGGSGGDIIFYTSTDNTPSERMRITSGGNVLIGTTSQLQSTERLAVTSSSNAAILAQYTGGATTGWAAKFWNNATSGDNLFIEFVTETSITARGSVTYNRGSGVTAYNTTSDYRIKTEISDFNSLNIISNLKPQQFRIGNATRKTIGFIAHELQEFFPQAVTGIKDQIDNFGNPIYQSVDYSQLTGLLVKAIQELKQEIDTLKN